MNIFAYAIKTIREVNRNCRVQRAVSALRQSGQTAVYADIGSAGGIPRHYKKASQRGVVALLLIDAQEDWRRSQDEDEYAGCDVRHIKVALGARPETRPFYVTAAPGCSSCLLPNELVLALFPVREWFRVVSRGEVVLRPYEEIHVELTLRVPDIVKIDVQGLELEVLIGFGKLLDKVTCVEMEVNFEQLYVGQPVVSEVYGFMRERGFVLRDLKPQGPFEGQAVEFNSYWSRKTLAEPRQRMVVTLWESIHDIWPGQYFADVNVLAHKYVRFS